MSTAIKWLKENQLKYFHLQRETKNYRIFIYISVEFENIISKKDELRLPGDDNHEGTTRLAQQSVQ